MYFALVIASLIVGTLIGTVGVGGILLIPALSAFAGLSTHTAMATALFSFIFTGVIGTWLYHRRGSIDWRITIPVCMGGALFGYIGALCNSMFDARTLNILLAGVIIFAGVYALKPYSGDRTFAFDASSKRHQFLLIGIGGAVGFGSGLTGVGGPVLSVPLMVIIGFSPLTAIATSQVIQITAAISGTIGNLAYGSIDFSVASWVTVVELVGVMIGVNIAHAAKAQHLKTFVSGICIFVGGFILIKALGLLNVAASVTTHM
ncbi:sulfite exporter TauE/SafE family protein [Nitratidesulfovibrio sp. 1201_IL3209]|uniref:sulfite exporter TauE/SafE family protein n=1 Tax=Nitratidesulfovibrio sp. 1201_IL3209 TaxID=3084053 RepID=UPI002FDB19D3